MLTKGKRITRSRPVTLCLWNFMGKLLLKISLHLQNFSIPSPMVIDNLMGFNRFAFFVVIMDVRHPHSTL